MIAEIISVGTELLLGNIVNTNAQFIAKKLAETGIEMHYQTVVGDNPERIIAALDIAYTRADMTILTGGLGPTKDDITKEKLAEYFHKKLVINEEAMQHMSALLEKVQKPSLIDSMRKMALVPDDSLILHNHHGIAPGCIMKDGKKICILLPGPPKEMEPMFEEYCMPYLKEISHQVIVSVNIKMLDFDHAPVTIVGEAPVADALGELLDGENPTVATYAKEDGCLIRITARANDRQRALELIEPVKEKCRAILKDEYIQWIREETE